MEIADIIVGLITALSTGGVFTAIFNRKQKRVLNKIEADSKVSDMWQELLEDERKERMGVQKRINYLYNENTKLRQALDKSNSRATALSVLRCGRINCSEREPPFGSTIDLDNEGNVVYREYKYPTKQTEQKRTTELDIYKRENADEEN